MYVYEGNEAGTIWRIGMYTLDGKFHHDSDASSREEAARRVNWLNGGAGNPFPAPTVIKK
jgi:hypothetical protein